MSNALKGTQSHRLKEILAVLYRHEVIKGVTPQKLRLILEDLGPTFVKIGQILSMRGDLLSEAFLRELSLLRDNVQPMPFAEVNDILTQEYAVSLDTVFSVVQEEPVGAASIAQVHKAQLVTGEKVVIKVQRAGIDERMQSDMALLRKAAGLLKLSGAAGGAVDFRAVLDEMWFVAQQEMDFLAEAQNIENFALFNRDIAYVTCPNVYADYTTRRVLVMEYVDGIPINQKEKLRDAGYDLKEMAERLCANYAKQILEDGFFHADPHPGNISIRGGKIVYLDLGMVGRLTPREQQLLKSAVKGIVLNDVQEAKDALLSLAVHKEPIDHARLYEDIETVINRYSRMEVGQMNIGTMMDEVLDIANRHSLKMPEGMAMLSRGLVTIQGVVSQLSPEVDFISVMAANIKGSIFDDFDIRRDFAHNTQSLYRSGKKALELPYQLSEFLKTALRGQGKINLELTGSEKPLLNISRMVNRLILCLLCCALLIASALICQTGVTPKWLGMPWPALLGFLATGGIGTVLMRMIWRGRK